MKRTRPEQLRVGQVIEYQTVGSLQAAVVTAAPVDEGNVLRWRVEAVNIQNYPGPVTLRFGDGRRVKVLHDTHQFRGSGAYCELCGLHPYEGPHPRAAGQCPDCGHDRAEHVKGECMHVLGDGLALDVTAVAYCPCTTRPR